MSCVDDHELCSRGSGEESRPQLCAMCGEHPRAVRSKNPMKYRRQCYHCHKAGQVNVLSRRKKRHGNARTVDEERVPKLHTGPICSWLTEKRREFATSRDLATYCRVDEKTVSWVLSGKLGHTSLDSVDKMLVAFGEPMMLGVLYPGLYDDPSVFA